MAEAGSRAAGQSLHCLYGQRASREQLGGYRQELRQGRRGRVGVGVYYKG